MNKVSQWFEIIVFTASQKVPFPTIHQSHHPLTARHYCS